MAVTMVYLMFVHGTGITNQGTWRAFIADSGGAVALAVHVDASSSPDLGALSHCRLDTSLNLVWGEAVIVSAEIQCAAEVLMKYPSAQHVLLCSGTDVPLKRAGLDELLPDMAYFQYYFEDDTEFLSKIRAELGNEEHDEVLQFINFHSQWCILSRAHAELLIDNEQEVMEAFEPVQAVFHRCDIRMAPDEWYMHAGLRWLGASDEQLIEKTVCAAYFARDGDKHPISFTGLTQEETYFADGRRVKASLCSICQDVVKVMDDQDDTRDIALTLRKVTLDQSAEKQQLLDLLQRAWI